MITPEIASQIMAQLLSMPVGKADIIAGLSVARIHGGFYVDGTKRLLSWNNALERLSRAQAKRRVRWDE